MDTAFPVSGYKIYTTYFVMSTYQQIIDVCMHLFLSQGDMTMSKYTCNMCLTYRVVVSFLSVYSVFTYDCYT